MARRYRKDIDGLRAISVISVLFFHANIAGFDGGFVGVDVFFVISGYLITTIIIDALDQNRFSLIGFYEKRARRILPALFAVFVVSTVFAVWLEAPKDLKNFGQSMIAATLFSSNILFFIEAGYFDQDSIFKPLLHTWSLGVEEQFYLIVPLLLMFVAAKSLKPFWIIAAISFVSFTLCAYHTPTYPEATFFLIPFRFWEIGAGSVLAVTRIRMGGTNAPNQILAVIGLLCIVLSVHFFDASTQFPGYWALVPCIGAILIIATGAQGETVVSRVLSIGPLVWVGLISYSLYLWHWPIIVFYRLFTVETGGGDYPFLTTPETVLIISASLAISAASWKFIEQPFRRKKHGEFQISRKWAISFSGALAFGAVLVGGAMHVGAGWPGRFERSVSQIADKIGVRPSLSCLNSGFAQNNDPYLREIGSSGPLTVALWGDSHAAHLTDGIANFAEAHSVKVGYYGVCGCPPLVGIERQDGKNYSCNKVNNWMLKRVTSDPEIKSVIIATRFQLWFEGVGYGPLEAHKGVVRLTSTEPDVAGHLREQKSVVLAHLQQTIFALQAVGKKVFVVYPVPEIGVHAPRSIFRFAAAGGEPDDFNLPLSDYHERVSGIVAGLDAVVEETDATAIRLDSVLCSDTGCRTTIDGNILYRDGDHLSPAGSMSVGHLFSNAIQLRP